MSDKHPEYAPKEGRSIGRIPQIIERLDALEAEMRLLSSAEERLTHAENALGEVTRQVFSSPTKITADEVLAEYEARAGATGSPSSTPTRAPAEPSEPGHLLRLRAECLREMLEPYDGTFVGFNDAIQAVRRVLQRYPSPPAPAPREERETETQDWKKAFWKPTSELREDLNLITNTVRDIGFRLNDILSSSKPLWDSKPTGATSVSSEVEAELKDWAEELAEEAFIQGYESGWENGVEQHKRQGDSGNRCPKSMVIRVNEYPFSPIHGAVMDGFEALRATLVAETQEERAVIQKIVDAYDIYRSRGALPAPASYQEMVEAINEARRFLLPPNPDSEEDASDE